MAFADTATEQIEKIDIAMTFGTNTDMRTLRLSCLLIATMVVAVVFFGCSEERNPSQLPSTHPVSWMESGSVDFHGKVALVNGKSGCIKCHGDDGSGGRVQVSCVECHLQSGVCTNCHGGLDNQLGAPPYGLEGEIEDTLLAVGAHTVHLSGSYLAAGIECSTCHLVPALLLEPSHLDLDAVAAGQLVDSIAEINFSGLVDSNLAVWDRTTRSCTGVYCHGAFENGRTTNAPVWTSRTPQAHCGSCHDIGISPKELGGIHDVHFRLFSIACAECHASVLDTGYVIVEPSLHVNGVVDTLTKDTTLCNACHGTGPEICVYCHGGLDNQTGAPPYGLDGESLAMEPAVGSHTTHVEGSYISDGVECDDCHLVPESIASPGHYDSGFVAELTWSTLSGDQSVWNRDSLSCALSYCHGNFAGGYADNTPIWTAPGQAACGSCHDVGSDPESLGGEHEEHVSEEGMACSQCHSTTVDAVNNIIGRAIHVNGINEVSFSSGNGTYSGGTCWQTSCHGSWVW